MAGKGDSPRPVDGEKYRQNWEQIFSPRGEKPIDSVSTIVHKCPQPKAATQPHPKATDE